LSVRLAMKYISEVVSGKRKMKMGKERLAGAVSGAYFVHFNLYHSRVAVSVVPELGGSVKPN